jgi:hypothetical protein
MGSVIHSGILMMRIMVSQGGLLLSKGSKAVLGYMGLVFLKLLENSVEKARRKISPGFNKT